MSKRYIINDLEFWRSFRPLPGFGLVAAYLMIIKIVLLILEQFVAIERIVESVIICFLAWGFLLFTFALRTSDRIRGLFLKENVDLQAIGTNLKKAFMIWIFLSLASLGFLYLQANFSMI